MPEQDLILIPGWGSNATVWNTTNEFLQKKYRVHAITLPRAINLDSYYQAVVRFIHKQNLQQVVLIGWSMGSLVALQTATRFPEKIRALVLVSGTSKFAVETSERPQDYPGGIPATLVRRMKKRLINDRLQALHDFYRMMFSSEERAALLDIEIMERYLLPGRQWSAEEAISGLEFLLACDTREDLSAITCPALLIHGSEDEICPLAGALFMAKKLRGEMIVLPGSGHIPFLTNSVNFHRYLAEWVERLCLQIKIK